MIFIHLTLNPTKVKDNEALWGLGRAFLPVGLPKPIVIDRLGPQSRPGPTLVTFGFLGHIYLSFPRNSIFYIIYIYFFLNAPDFIFGGKLVRFAPFRAADHKNDKNGSLQF